MNTVPRLLSRSILSACRSFGAVVLTGPRRSGKTWLLRHLFPKAQYLLFEDLDVVGRFRRIGNLNPVFALELKGKVGQFFGCQWSAAE